MYPFTVVRPDRTVVVRAGSPQQLEVRLSRWTTVPLELLREVVPDLWRYRVVCIPEHATTLLRGELSW